MEEENKRAERLAFRISEYHSVMNAVYENLVDRDFESVEADIKFLIMEMKLILKSIPDDDF
jgi:hypothetical protein